MNISVVKDFIGYGNKLGVIFLMFIIALLSRLNIYNIYFVDAFSICVLLFFFQRIQIDSFGYLLMFFSISYSGISFINGSIDSMFETIGIILSPLAFYIFGKIVIQRTESNQQLISFILFVLFFSCINLYLLILEDIQISGLINVYRRIGEKGSDNSVAVATLLGMVASLGLGGFSYCIMEQKPLWSLESWIYFSCTILSLLSVIHLINRTGIVVCAIIIICVILYKIRGNLIKILPILLLLLIFYLLLLRLGIVNNEVLDAYEARNLDEKGTGSANGRFDRWIDACTLMFQYPFGWSKMNGALYCHSLWFDTARVSGIIPFFTMLYITIKGAAFTKRLIEYKGNILVGVFLGYTVCMYLSASMEPVLEGASSYFYLMCLFWGLQNEYYNNYNRFNYEC